MPDRNAPKMLLSTKPSAIALFIGAHCAMLYRCKGCPLSWMHGTPLWPSLSGGFIDKMQKSTVTKGAIPV